MTDDEQEPLHLAQLNGAILTWETKDGETRKVEFDDTRDDE